MGSSGAIRPTSSLSLNIAPVTAAAIPAAVTEGLSGSGGSPANLRRGRKNLVGVRRWRIVGRVSVASSAATKASFQWSLNLSTWFWPDGVAAASAPGVDAYISMASAVLVATNWIDIPLAARGQDVHFRAMTLDGDGATTGAVAHFTIEFG